MRLFDPGRDEPGVQIPLDRNRVRYPGLRELDRPLRLGGSLLRGAQGTHGTPGVLGQAGQGGLGAVDGAPESGATLVGVRSGDTTARTD